VSLHSSNPCSHLTTLHSKYALSSLEWESGAYSSNLLELAFTDIPVSNTGVTEVLHL